MQPPEHSDLGAVGYRRTSFVATLLDCSLRPTSCALSIQSCSAAFASRSCKYSAAEWCSCTTSSRLAVPHGLLHVQSVLGADAGNQSCICAVVLSS